VSSGGVHIQLIRGCSEAYAQLGGRGGWGERKVKNDLHPGN
jgi:hypothetical protein